MSWIPAVSKDQASPEVKRIYDFLGENWASCPTTFWPSDATPNCFRTR